MKQFLAGLLFGSFLLGVVFGVFSINQQIFQEEAMPVQTFDIGQPRADDVWMISRMVAAEARGESFQGQVAVAAVIANRVRDPRFPATVYGVIYQPLAFEPIQNGTFWTVNPTDEHVRAARYALNGWDPTSGATFFWNPATATSRWIWNVPITSRIGDHVFGN